MQFISNILKKVINKNLLKAEDFYELSEKEIINIIKKSPYKNEWIDFAESTNIKRSDDTPNSKFYVCVSSKKRYVIPLCKKDNRIYRLNQISNRCQKLLDKFINYEDSKYSFI
jgi:hypothetical protein